jgi:cysteine desulfurase
MTAIPRAYLDHNATSPLRPEARAAMVDAFNLPGNASSVHAEGRAARAALENARARIAAGLGGAARNVVFTSGATEAANLLLTPSVQSCGVAACDGAPVDLLLMSAVEHTAVLAGHRFGAATQILPVDANGALRLEALDAALAKNAGRRIMVALQAANNETGVIQPTAAAAELVHAAGGLLVCDATQAVGRIKTSLTETGADILFCSAHKIGGPKGIGAIVFARDDIHIQTALIRGGGQERGRRAGTENIAAAAGFAAALDAALKALPAEAERLAALREEIERLVREASPPARLLGAGAPRLPNVAAFVLPGVKAQTLLMALDLEGVALSSGSACSSGKVKASHVLAAMGETETESLRASLGWNSTPDDVQKFGIAFAVAVGRMKARHAVA